MSLKTHIWEGNPIQRPTLFSNQATIRLPKSRLCHSSKHLQRNSPKSSGSTDHSVTTESGEPGRAAGEPTTGMDAASQWPGATRSKDFGSTQGMNWIVGESSSRVRKR